MTKKTKSKKVKKGIFAPDMHYPLHDEAAMKILFDFAKDFKPDYFILGGDQLDMGSISYYNKKKPKLVEGERLKNDYIDFQEDVLDKLDSILPSGAEKYFMIGNHEYRVDRLIECEPQHEGFIEVENNLKLDDWNVVDMNDFIKIGKMVFIHGIRYNKYFSRYNLIDYNENIFCGHVHKLQMFTKCSPIDGQPKIGVGVPCLCDTNPEWKRGSPNDWLNGFMFWYQYPDGSFNFYIPIVVNNKATINGKVYEG